jgi:hypothetical protein
VEAKERQEKDQREIKWKVDKGEGREGKGRGIT